MLLIVLVLACKIAVSQESVNLKEIKPNADFDNIHIKKVYTDQNSTSFVIWVEKSVRPHFHKVHTESLYVIEGTAEMKIGDKTLTIKEGDYFTVPENTIHSVVVTSKIPLKVLSLQAPEFLGEDRHFVED